MKQKEIFDDLLARVVQLSIDVANERDKRLTAERRLAEVANTQPPVDARQVHELLGFMVNDRKIDAIRTHRALTGYGLKESKDAVERVMNRFVLRAAA